VRLRSDADADTWAFALRALAEEVLANSAGDAIERHCELVLHDGDARVRGDPLLLQALLRNLVDNALRHGGGTQVEISITQQDRQAVLCVSDNGRGIAADERDRVPQRFYSAAIAPADAPAHQVAGSGLGLSIVSRITELHGGTLEIGSPAAWDNGVSLLVHLPLADDAGLADIPKDAASIYQQ
jgi:signal transduction histidine kinase